MLILDVLISFPSARPIKRRPHRGLLMRTQKSFQIRVCQGSGFVEHILLVHKITLMGFALKFRLLRCEARIIMLLRGREYILCAACSTTMLKDDISPNTENLHDVQDEARNHRAPHSSSDCRRCPDTCTKLRPIR
jgi:hypothetical protein